MVCRMAKTVLQRCGYSVLTAKNGQEAVDLFREFHDRVALVLLDMTMPVMSGEEAFQRLQAIAPEVKVILSSGFNEVEAIQRFLDRGLTGFLQKPTRPPNLPRRSRRSA